MKSTIGIIAAAIAIDFALMAGACYLVIKLTGF